MDKLKWWKWHVWIMIAGQGILIWGIYKFAMAMKVQGAVDRSQLLPWVGWGLGLYLVGRGLQVAARSRARRLAKEEAAREER